MRIEVILETWQFDCCGTITEIGDEVDWFVYASDPETHNVSGLRSFREDHHDSAPGPVERVQGRVVHKRGVRYPVRPMIGVPIGHEVDGDNPEYREIEEFEAAEEEYAIVVDLEVPDATVLPPYVPVKRDSLANYSLEMSDAVGLAMQQLARRAASRFEDLATVDLADEARAVSVRPHNADAASVHWNRVANDADYIMVYVGRGQWRLPSEATSIETIEDMLHAAVKGRVHEIADFSDERFIVSTTRVIGKEEYEASRTQKVMQIGAGVVFASYGPIYGQPWEPKRGRVNRFSYPAW